VVDDDLVLFFAKKLPEAHPGKNEKT
jgi:hypothetical protein